MKRGRNILAVLLLAVSVQASNKPLLRYEWTAQMTSIYTVEVRVGDRIISTSTNILTTLEIQAGEALLAVEDTSSTNYVLFATIDKAGQITNRKLSSLRDFAAVDPADTDAFRKAQSALQLHRFTVVPLPKEPVSLNEPFTDAEGHGWTCLFEKGLYIIRTTQDSGTKNPFREYVLDKNRGILVKFIEREQNETISVMLSEFAPVSDERRKHLELLHGGALSLDEFRFRAIRPFARSKDRITRQRAYGALLAISDDAMSLRLAHEMLKLPDSDEGFRFFVSPWFLRGMAKGLPWAIKSFETEDWVTLQHADLHENAGCSWNALSGLRFVNDRTQMTNWCARIEMVLPEFGKTGTDQMVRALDHTDPWVRMFALRQLSIRREVDLAPLVNKALKDNDPEVRDCARSVDGRRRVSK